MTTDKSDASINFVWGHVGKKLQKLDPERMLSLTQQNPDYSLSVLTNIEIEILMADLFPNGKQTPNLNANIQKRILALNTKDNTFREIARFLRYKQDMLSIGSTITGQIDRTNLPMRFDYKKDTD